MFMDDSKATASPKILPCNGWQLKKTASLENSEQLEGMLVNLEVSSVHSAVVTINITLERGHVNSPNKYQELPGTCQVCLLH